MMRLVVSCVWVSAVTAAATYVSGSLRLGEAQTVQPAPAGRLEQKKIQPINVPMIANGNIAGYVVAKFVYLARTDDLANLSFPPDAFIADEAFRTLYSSPLDFRHIEKYDLPALAKTVVEKANRRLGADVVKEILVEEFMYVPRRELSK